MKRLLPILLATQYAVVLYPCGCKAGPYTSCPIPLPDYCPDHGTFKQEDLQ